MMRMCKHVRMCVRVRVCAHARFCVCVCVRVGGVSACVFVHACVRVCA